jgi:hypothetical protein
MSPVRHMDGSSIHTAPTGGQEAAVSVRQPAQVLDARDYPWPFMYEYKEGRCIVHTAPRRSAYAQAQDVGEALI